MGESEDKFPIDLEPYAIGDWKTFDNEDTKSIERPTRSSETIKEQLSENEYAEFDEGQSSPWDKVLKGPIWNYEKWRDGEECCYRDLLFGKIRHKTISEDEKVLKGPAWTPSRPKAPSFVRQLFRKLKKAPPDSVALVEIETRRSLTYSEVIEKSRSLASGLRWLGISPGQHVAVVSYNSLEAHLMVLASLLVGSIVSLIDPSLNPADIGALLRVSCPRLIFTESGKTLNKVESAMGYLFTKIFPDVVVNSMNTPDTLPSRCFKFSQLLVKIETDFQPAYRDANPNTPLFMLYTSGTTDTPKGALIPEKYLTKSNAYAAVSSTLNTTGKPGPYTTLLTNPLNWVSQVNTLLLQLWSGNRVAFFRGYASEAVIIKALYNYKVRVWVGTPFILMSLLRWPARPRCPMLKIVVVSGCVFPTERLLQVHEQVFATKVNIIQIYGMTECGILTANSLQFNKLGSVGKVFFNIKLKVVDPLTGIMLGPCEEGELCFKSETMMLGYYNHPEETDRAFDNDGYFHTGDLGFYDEQEYVYVSGRLKELIKWKTYQIIPTEVEVMLKNHPAVKDAAVFGLYDELEGQIVTAAVTLNRGVHADTAQAICDTVNAQLSYTKRIRGGIHIFDKFPETAAGKVIKRDILQEVLERKDIEACNEMYFSGFAAQL